jgi:urease subunit beta
MDSVKTSTQGAGQTPAVEHQTDMHPLYPDKQGYKPQQAVVVGGVILGNGDISYNGERRSVKLKVSNTGDRPIQVGSHFHFFEVNRYLEFDRTKAFGTHLNIPATTAIRFEPGDEREVEVVPFAGKQRLIGFNSLTMGYAGTEDDPVYYPTRTAAFARMHREGFACCCNEKCNKTSKS